MFRSELLYASIKTIFTLGLSFKRTAYTSIRTVSSLIRLKSTHFSQRNNQVSSVTLYDEFNYSMNRQSLKNNINYIYICIAFGRELVPPTPQMEVSNGQRTPFRLFRVQEIFFATVTVSKQRNICIYCTHTIDIILRMQREYSGISTKRCIYVICNHRRLPLKTILFLFRYLCQ